MKHEESIHQGSAVDGLLSQVRQAFGRPFKRVDSPRECHVSAVYVFNSGEITANAKEQLLSQLEREHYGDNVHFLDGERLEALNEWATLQSDTNSRARLVGLRSALRFNIRVLRESYTESKSPNPESMFIRGVELYLSEPVNCDDQLLTSLFRLWQMLESLENVRKMSLPTSQHWKAIQDKLWTPAVELAQKALPLALEIHQKVDAAIEKLKPLE